MATSTVSRQIASVRRSAEKMDAAAPATIGTASAGDVVRQGDIYLVCLDAEPAGKQIKDRQLAPGTTQGSRHIAVGNCRILECDASVIATRINKLVRNAAVPAELVGPVIVCRGEVTIEHPEHGHRTLPADTVWGSVFQRAFAEEIRRVQD